ncbi:MAG: 50S ribosomal protein L15 [Planctomycetota bacterium]
MSQAHLITQGLKHKRKQRLGRGEGSKGKTSGRGHKGARSRTGSHIRVGHEGGQTEHAKRFGQRGFSNFKFQTRYYIVNLSSLEKKFDAGKTVDAAALQSAGLIPDHKQGVKILGNGEITKELTILADKFSGSAQKKIEAAGGKCQDPSGEPYAAEAPAEQASTEEPAPAASEDTE